MQGCALVLAGSAAALSFWPTIAPGSPQAAGPPSECASCIQRAPAVSGFTGPSLLVTDRGDSSTAFVLHLFDVTGFGSVPPGLWSPPRYEHPSWTQVNLGSVFGVTSDEAGHVYLAHGSFMLGATAGTVGGGSGAVIRISTATGSPTLLATLPQSSFATGPGLGNIAWSCSTQSLFVSNFEDGRIYRIDPALPPALRVRSAWDFATDVLSSGGAPEAGDAPGVVPRGERVWAVAPAGGRLFFSVWSRDAAHPSDPPNSIWSVDLDANGDPLPGTKALEVLLDGPGFLPSPVSDLAFTADCELFAVQRPMFDLVTGAHFGELMKFRWDPMIGGGSWQREGAFEVGALGGVAFGKSTAGGVAVDPSPDGLVWATGDFLLLAPPTYGVQGLPQSGGGLANSLMIDADGDSGSIGDGDKLQQGSVSFAKGTVPGCEIELERVECVLGPDGLPTGQFAITLSVINNSGKAVTSLLLRTLGQVVSLNPPLPSGSSTSVTVVVSGNGGDLISLLVGFYGGGAHCCSASITVELPICECMLIRDVEVECIDDGNPNTFTYAVSFKLRNIALNPSFTASWLFLTPPPGSDWFFLPTVVSVLPLPPGAETTIQTTLIFTSPPMPGPPGLWSITVPLSLHQSNLAICCSGEVALEGPLNCGPPCSPDLNGDGVVNGADLAILLGLWGPAGAGTCADLNGDGIVDGADLAILLGAWS
ncbi:MAG: hypothetical protein KF724_04825 [Phycisphaeraceae bacterium]|nr:hypothetical protein [Phycisphaeraceae bacterium]